MTVVVTAGSQGATFGVKAQPGARRNAIVGEYDGCLKIAVTQAAEKGKANEAIIAVVCDALSLSKRRISIVSGATTSRKKLLVAEMDPAELAARIAEIISRINAQ